MREINSNVRLKWIDELRGALFLCVIMVHTGCCPSFLRWIFDPFYLTGFFFLSGYLYSVKPISVKLKNLFNGLIAPYLLYCIILTIVYTIIDYNFDIFTFVKSTIWLMTVGGNNLWFIPCLIIVELLYILYCFFFKNSTVSILILIGLSFLAYFVFTSQIEKHYYRLNSDTACWCLLYFGLGLLVKKCKELSLNKKYIICILGTYLLFSVAAGFLGIGGGKIDIHNNYITNKIVFIPLSIYGVLSIFLFFKNIGCHFSIIQRLGRITLFSFPFHGFIIDFFNDHIVKAFFGCTFMNIAFLLDVILVPIVLVIIGGFFERYFPIILGKYKYIK